MDTTDQPNSMIHVRTIEMYKLPTDFSVDTPFKLLCGEAVLHTGTLADGILLLTNFRLYLESCDSEQHVPLGMIETVEHRDLFYLHIGCKDARTFKCTFDNNENCMEWLDRLLKASSPPRVLEELFAFFHYAWSKEKRYEDTMARIELQRTLMYDETSFRNEVDRLKFDIHGVWRISSVNKNYQLCPSYPPQLLVPSCITDATLETIAKFRSSRRIPAVVWRHVGNGAVIARCSQPEVGWWGWRCAEDEDLLKAIFDACNYDRGPKALFETNRSSSPNSINSGENVQARPDITDEENKKVLIMDARSYTTAVANRARGGGCEYPEYYPSCEIQFMNLANIHTIRKSFHALRALCMGTADQQNWFSQLEATRWYLHMAGLMQAALTVATAVERDARPVMVHCSDGWDRTPQIVSLAELLLDPHYRTIDGFRILIEREWLSFGHKFADRCGHATGSEDQNERCPVFLQWLDCVHQLLIQFPCAFEFSQIYLVKMVHHTYSNLFGTFLCNTKRERMERVNDNTFSVWSFLSGQRFRNYLYNGPSASTAGGGGDTVLWPKCNVRDMQLWSEVYLGSLEMDMTGEISSGSCPGPPDLPGEEPHMTKTRSYGDLQNAFDGAPSQFRRSSDPSITLDIKLNNGDNSSTDGFLMEDIDCKSDCLFKATTPSDNENVIFGKTDAAVAKDLNLAAVTNGFESICLKSSTTSTTQQNGDSGDCGGGGGIVVGECSTSRSDINHNGDVNNVKEDVDSDTECTEPSENTVKSAETNYERSVETSTETLVSENLLCSSSPKDACDFEKLTNPDVCNGNGDICKACVQYYKTMNDKHNRSGENSGKTSRYSTPPLFSRTSSTNGWDSSLTVQPLQQHHHYHRNTYAPLLGDDGLVNLRSDVQDRLWQIMESHRKREEALQRELHTYRQALIKQVCHRCSHTELDKQDDTCSVVESVCSAGEGQASAVESLRSDMSWEAVEDGCILPDGNPTLWVPDHAVSRCTGCQTEFWLGRRKHHCRSCGRIFCADCSENSTPLPSEHLYNPVRVCTTCYSKLKHDCGEIPDHCKHVGNQPTNNNPQIAASSN